LYIIFYKNTSTTHKTIQVLYYTVPSLSAFFGGLHSYGSRADLYNDRINEFYNKHSPLGRGYNYTGSYQKKLLDPILLLDEARIDVKSFVGSDGFLRTDKILAYAQEKKSVLQARLTDEDLKALGISKDLDKTSW
jgi:hypothetical protein